MTILAISTKPVLLYNNIIFYNDSDKATKSVNNGLYEIKKMGNTTILIQ